MLNNVDSEDHIKIADISDHDGAAACSNVLPILLNYTSKEEEQLFIKEVIVKALTHNNDNVRHQAADGVREHLWSRDPEFAQMCVFGTIEYARIDKEELQNEYRRSYNIEDHEVVRSSLQAKKDEFRASFTQSRVSLSAQPISLDTHSASHILCPCLMIPDGSREQEHIQFYSQVLEMFYTSEQKDYSERDDVSHLNDEVASKFSNRFAQYMFPLHAFNFMDYVELLNKGCEEAPKIINYLMLCIAEEAEKSNKEAIYWQLWELLSSTIKSMAINSAYVERDKYSQDERRGLLRSLLKVDMPWQKTNEDDQLVKYGKTHLLNFCQDTCLNPDVFEALSRLMHYFPKIFFEQGIHILAQYQKKETGLRLLSGTNTTFYLEKTIQRFLQRDQTGPLPRKMHASCLTLLNAVVDTGSAQAYSLREHLIRSRRIL